MQSHLGHIHKVLVAKLMLGNQLPARKTAGRSSALPRDSYGGARRTADPLRFAPVGMTRGEWLRTVKSGH
jgi:hypothetical protein